MTAARASDDNNAAADLSADIEKLKAELAKLTKILAKTGEDGVGAARETAAEGVSRLRAKGEAVLGKLGDGAEDMESHVVAYVREKPFTSLAIAAGVGCLALWLLRR